MVVRSGPIEEPANDKPPALPGANWFSSNGVRVVAVPKPGAQETACQCRNRMDYFEGVFTLFRHKSPNADHSKCFFKGDECLRIRLTRREVRYETWKKIGALVGAWPRGRAKGAYPSRPELKENAKSAPQKTEPKPPSRGNTSQTCKTKVVLSA